MSEERMAKERLSDEVHALKSRALSEESARGSRSVQEVRYISGLNFCEPLPAKSRALSEESARGSRSVQEVR